LRFAYADPPYLGQARKHYGSGAREVNHRVLIGTLSDLYPDGWVLSCSSPSLRDLLPLCPPDVRVLAWVKPFHCYKKGVSPAYAWEPVIFRGGRIRPQPPYETPKDFVSANITLRKGLVGAKPEVFCRWLFDCLNAQPGDQLDDLFPGSGVVGRVWSRYLAELAGDQAALERQGSLL
jgi:hypothetical protein